MPQSGREAVQQGQESSRSGLRRLPRTFAEFVCPQLTARFSWSQDLASGDGGARRKKEASNAQNERNKKKRRRGLNVQEQEGGDAEEDEGQVVLVRVRLGLALGPRARTRAWVRVRVRATRHTMQVPPQSPQRGGTAPNSTAGSPLDLLGRAVSRAFRGGM